MMVSQHFDLKMQSTRSHHCQVLVQDYFCSDGGGCGGGVSPVQYMCACHRLGGYSTVHHNELQVVGCTRVQRESPTKV